MSTPSSPGERLRTLRQHLGLTGQAIGNELSVTKTAVSYWEGDRVALPRSIALALEQLYGVSTQWLLTGTGPMWGALWTTKQPSLPEGLVRVALLDPALAFDSKGKVQPPGPHALSLCFPRSSLESLTPSLPEVPENLYLWLVSENDMAPALKLEDWVLLDASPSARATVHEHGIYLVRIRASDPPVLRRLATDPVSGDLLMAVDAPGRVPLRLTFPKKDVDRILLARAYWSGGRLT